jgi:hypothetical protein
VVAWSLALSKLYVIHCISVASNGNGKILRIEKTAMNECPDADQPGEANEEESEQSFGLATSETVFGLKCEPSS